MPSDEDYYRMAGWSDHPAVQAEYERDKLERAEREATDEGSRSGESAVSK